jgi:hypothetical protein
MNAQRNKKTSNGKDKIMRNVLICLLLLLMAAINVPAYADVVIGDWEDDNDGWVDWNSGSPISISDPTLSSRYSYSSTTGVTLHSYSLVVSGITGYTQCLTIQLQNNDLISDFMANKKLLIDFSVAAGTVGGWNELYNVSLNAEGYGWGDLGTAPLQHFDFWAGSPARTVTVVIDYNSALASIPENPGWVEFIFALNSGSGTDSHEFYFDNARFVTTAAQDPSPADTATDVDLAPTLSWTAGYGTDSHNVYFGTDNPPPLVSSNQTGTTYNPGTLESNTTYYWRIDEVNDTDYNTTGDVWSFTTGNIYALTITKCKVNAGKTQGADSGDIDNIKDSIQLAGTADFPTDANQITQLDINIISVADDEIIYNQTITDINAYLNGAENKISYTHRITKGTAGAVYRLKLDFVNSKFLLYAKKVDLTGLGGTVKLELVMPEIGATITGEADETVVNGRKLIPTRLMRMYQDTLIVTRAKAKHSTKPLSDSLSVRGEIAVEDINNTDMNEPNLAARDVNFIWGNQTFAVHDGNFVAYKTGHRYKCKKIQSDVNEGVVTANFDLDKCKFTLSITKAENLNALPDYPDVNFSMNYGIGDANDFNETADVNLVTRRSY